MLAQTNTKAGYACVEVRSLLPCHADLAWEALQTSGLFAQVAGPILGIRALAGETLPARWSLDRIVRCQMFLFGGIPLGERTLQFKRIDSEAREIQTHEFDALISRWDHRLQVQPQDDQSCWYSDRIEIEAGLLTPLLQVMARLFFWYRHRRWQKVAQQLSATQPV